MRNFVVAVGSLIALTSCSQGEPAAPEADMLAMPNLIGWRQVATENVNVPEGVTFNPIEIGEARVVEIAGVAPSAIASQKTGGVSVQMSEDFENRASGNQILVTVRAYSEQADARLGVAYSTNDVGNSGWFQFPLTTTPSDYQFVYQVPMKRAGSGDFLGFRSYDSQTVRVVGFQTSVLPRSRATSSEDLLRTTQSE